MNSIRKIGVIFGVLAFLICLLAGSIVMCPAIEKFPVISTDTGIGAFFIGTGFFFASLLMLIGSHASGSATVKKSRPVKTAVKKKAPAAKGKAPAKSSAKPVAEQDNKVAIYAGNLSLEATEDDLRRAFEPFGKVLTVNVVMDKFSGKSKGFGFVEMPDKLEAASAIEALNEHDMAGRKLKVTVARSMPRPGGSGQRRRPRPSAKN
jgi:Na+-transporting methylmalonyl-CoA/oxaloacetate decarboxylase gamma subunit